jgi:aarF domain-containing kinase
MSRNAPVTFPRPLQIWSTTDLLIEEYQNAVPLELFLKNGGGPYDDQLAELGLDAFLVRDIGCYRSVLIGRSEHVALGQLRSLRLASGEYYGQVLSPTTSLVLKTLWTSFFADDADSLSLFNDPTCPESNAIVSNPYCLSLSLGSQVLSSVADSHRSCFRRERPITQRLARQKKRNNT